MKNVGYNNGNLTFIILVLSLISLTVCNNCRADISASIVQNKGLCILLIYVALRLLLSCFPKFIYYAMLLSIVILCSRDMYLGLLQLLGLLKSNCYLYAITGSFDNPGPYGGFLAVCISLLTAYIVKCTEKKENKITIKIEQQTDICDNENREDQSNIRGTHNKIFSQLLYWIIITVTLISSIILPSTQSRAALLALGCSLLLLIISIDRLRPFLRKYGIWLLLAIAILGIKAYNFKKDSADGRMFINRISLMSMYTNNWRGAGLGHFGETYGKTQASFFIEQINNGSDNLDWTLINEHNRLTADCPDNAFNEYLNIGVEAGLITMLLFIGVIISAIISSYRNSTIWCYGLIAFAIFAMFSYPLHIIQFQILFPILLAACTSSGKSATLSGKLIMTTLLIILSVILIGKIPEMKRHKQAESAWKKTERWHTMAYYGYVIEDCNPLLEDMKYDYHFLFAYGQSLNKTGNYEKSDSILMLGAKISSDPMFWNVMGNNSLALGKYREAEERYKHAFYMVPNRLYPLALLAKLYHTEGDTVRFLNMAEKVETFVPKKESVNTESLRNEIAEIKLGYERFIKQKD